MWGGRGSDQNRVVSSGRREVYVCLLYLSKN